MSNKQLQNKLLENEELHSPGTTPQALPDSDDYSYKLTNQEPTIRLSNLSLVILTPLLVLSHTFLAGWLGIPMLQYAFVACLCAFLINYLGIIRKYELYPYLPEPGLDNRLKAVCFMSFLGFMLSLYYGWNGSGGLLFAMFWEVTRGQRMTIYGLYFGCIILGSLLMEDNYSLTKLWEFLPGLLLGWVNSEVFKLKESNPYTISHELLFLCSIGFPVFFPAVPMVVPSLWQWGAMVVGGVLMLVTVVLTVRVMQLVRVSVVVGVTAGLLMAGSSQYLKSRQYVGAVLILAGIVMLLKTEYSNAM